MERFSPAIRPLFRLVFLAGDASHGIIRRAAVAAALMVVTATIISPPVHATDTPVTVSMFERSDCAHCRDEVEFLEGLSARDGSVVVVRYDIDIPENRALFERFTAGEGLSKSTPITLVGTVVLQGFDDADTTGKRIEELVHRVRASGSGNPGFEGLLDMGGSEAVEKTVGGTCESGDVCVTPGGDPFLVTIPFVGAIDVAKYSLPAMAAVLGLVDGFNPCALWVLVTFLLVLVQIGDRSRMWLIAGSFIVAETVMYYLILNVWFTAWDFVGLNRFVTPLVGTLAIGGGLFFLYEWLSGNGTCKVTAPGKRVLISARIHRLAMEPFTWVSLAGVVALALSVNVIEFACSIGIPQAFTKIIELNGLGFAATQGMMALYILFYMIDDFFVFGLALWGVERLQSSHIYARYCNLVGGIVMIILGLLLILAPEHLMF